MPLGPKTYRAGDPLRAADVREERDEIARLGAIVGSARPPDRPGEPTWIRLTSSASGGAYSWAEVERDYSTHAWILTGTTGAAGTDGAFEQNGDATLTSGTKVYPATRSETSGEMIFEKV